MLWRSLRPPGEAAGFQIAGEKPAQLTAASGHGGTKPRRSFVLPLGGAQNMPLCRHFR
jgi:hypothetical protein